ncbi:uncharacterized protein VTP21DRAFT_7765 [Calcarisporiella thermophila]|uniref:uncharacterized protein n=1 Tax=Calcarisporiella thermophila TaxID=911321 RepID=UPI0037436941
MDPEPKDTEKVAESNPRRRLTSPSRCLITYLAILALYACVICATWFVTDNLPTALPSEVATTSPGQFSGKAAWEHLEFIANESHPVNSQRNREVREYIIEHLVSLQREAALRNVKIELDTNDTVVYHGLRKNYRMGTKEPRAFDYVESTNVLAKVIGQSNSSDAFMVSAHYDSVDGSMGATDDGAAIAIMLELIRNIIHNPVDGTVIFNFNNAEEEGLLGSLAFTKHPWSKDVRAFVNLEGAGTGGPSLLFRLTGPAFGRAYRSVPYAHTNAFAQDQFEMGSVKSQTDYSVYIDNGMMGMDMAFYHMRSLYHTYRDDLNHITPGSVQQMGANTLQLTRTLADSKLLSSEELRVVERYVMFDIMGRQAVCYAFSTYRGLNIMAIVLTPLGYAVGLGLRQFVLRRRGSPLAAMASVGHAFATILISVVAAIVLMLVFVLILNRANPMALYGYPHLSVICFALMAMTAVSLVQYIWGVVARCIQKRSTSNSSQENTQPAANYEQALTHGMVWLWWCGVIISLALSYRNMGGLYFMLYFWAFAAVAAVLDFVVPKKVESWMWVVRLILTCTFPLILTVGLSYVAINGIPATVQDGTSPLIPAVLYCLVGLLAVLPLLPYTRRAGYPGITTLVLFLVAIALFIPLAVRFPFHQDTSPAKVAFTHTIYPTTNRSVAVAESRAPLRQALESASQKGARIWNMTCRQEGGKEICEYEVPVAEWAAGKMQVQPTKYELTTRNGGPQRVARVDVQLNGTGYCEVFLQDKDRVSNFWVQGMDPTAWAASESKADVFVVQLRNAAPIQNLSLFFELAGQPASAQEGGVHANLYCRLFGGTLEPQKGGSPAYADLVRHLDDWAVPFMLGGYLLRVSQELSL